jgi:hypothetical protein
MTVKVPGLDLGADCKPISRENHRIIARVSRPSSIRETWGQIGAYSQEPSRCGGSSKARGQPPAPCCAGSNASAHQGACPAFGGLCRRSHHRRSGEGHQGAARRTAPQADPEQSTRPLANRATEDPKSLRDQPVVSTFGRSQHNSRAQRQCLTGRAPPRQRLQLRAALPFAILTSNLSGQNEPNLSIRTLVRLN